MARNIFGSAKKRVTFQLATEPGKTVFVAGTFNDWSPDKTPMTDLEAPGRYSVSLMVPKGRHEYKFIVDGVWLIDPECPEWVPNNHGSLNSVLNVE